MNNQRFGEYLFDGKVRVQRRRRILKDQLNFAPCGLERFPVHFQDVAALVEDLPGAWLFQTDKATRQARLAGP